jgi:DHA1 family bicyclomycin/chloramphenicol resistance-like MFS transporter
MHPLASAARPSRVLAAGAIALLLGLQPVVTDIYLPALPLLTRELGASMAQAQLTMSALILAFGIAQLFWGPVADRYGRRPVLAAGLVALVFASLAAALAPSAPVLIGARIVQGAALAAAVVVARAMVRDLYEPAEGARVMAWALSGLGVIALAGPVAGGVVAGLSGWRATLAIVVMFGLATLVFTRWKLPETIPARNPRATAPGPLLANWAAIARHPTFVAWTALMTCTYGGLFVVLAGSSFVYIEILGLSPAGYGLTMAAGSVAYLAGTFACRRWIARHGTAGAVARGAGFTLVAGVSVLALALAGVQAVWAVLVPQCLYAFGHGIHQPCAQASAVGPFPHAAGAASALAGFTLAAVAFGIGLWLGSALDGRVLPYAATHAVFALLTCAAAWTLVPRAERRTAPVLAA